MKILYAVQGTGNGHLSRARDIIPLLQKHHEIDLLVSGSQADVELPYEVKYRFKGLGFIFGKRGGIDILQTYRKNKVRRLFAEIDELPVGDYDLVLNDFEPVSAWACYQKNVRCVALSHQAAVLNKNVPVPEKIDHIGRAILKKYAPAAAHYGFHFKAYDSNIFTPVIRKQVRDQPLTDDGHYTVYLPAYDDIRILKVLEQFPDINWEVFSKHNKKVIRRRNIIIAPIENEAFIASMASCEGVLCGAGFEAPAEALFMKKKLLVVPMSGQYEQQCNAAALKDMGVSVIKSFKLKHVEKIRQWIDGGSVIEVDYGDNTEAILKRIIAENAHLPDDGFAGIGKRVYSERKFRRILLERIVGEL